MGSVLTYNGSVLKSSNVIFENNYIPATEKGAASGVASLELNGKVTGDQITAPMKTITINYTLTDNDNGYLLVCDSANVTITLPNSVLTAGFEIEIMNYGGYTVTIASENSSVYINGVESSSVSVPERYTSAILKLIDNTNKRWVIQGVII